MQLYLNSLINSEKNKPCFILAHGPSLVSTIYYKDEIARLNPVLMSCNQWFKFFSLPIDYWVIANNEFSVYKHYELINEHKNTKLLYADSVFNDEERIKTPPLGVDYLKFDERNYNFESNTPNINRLLSTYTNFPEFYKSSATVALHMVAFAIILGCNPIYISGMDLDHKKGYAFNARPQRTSNDTYLNELDAGRESIIKSLIILNSSARNIGTKIYSFDKQPSFDIFEPILGVNLK